MVDQSKIDKFRLSQASDGAAAEGAAAIAYAFSESFGPGSIVTLKTGGPSMVVTERSADKVRALWHDGEGSLHDTWIPTIAVKVRP